MYVVDFLLPRLPWVVIWRKKQASSETIYWILLKKLPSTYMLLHVVFFSI